MHFYRPDKVPVKMTAKEAAAIAGLVLAGTGGALLIANKPKPPAIEVKSLSAELGKKTIPPSTVYKMPFGDGGFVYASKYDVTTQLLDGGQVREKMVIYLDQSPCAWRATAADTCRQVDGGAAPVRATMQAGAWDTTSACTRKACVIYQGETE